MSEHPSIPGYELLRLRAEFDNFRKRTNQEKIDLRKTATEDLISELLPVLDDFERGKQTMENASDVEAVKEGVELVFSKLVKTLEKYLMKLKRAIR